jgi:hypothetical protein
MAPEREHLSSPVAGWYPDPHGDPTRIRWWDGFRWTEHYHTAAAVEPRPPVHGLRVLAALAVGALVLAILAELWSVLGDLNYRNVAHDFTAGMPVEYSKRVDALARVEDASRLLTAAYVLSALSFIPWFHRAYTNLRGLGATTTRFETGWAIGSWFVPLLNWVRPKVIADEIWRNSQPGAWRTPAPAVPAFVHLWWAMFLISGIGGWVGGAMIGSANDAPVHSYPAFLAASEKEQTGFLILAACGALMIVAGVLAILFVVRVSAAQREGGESPALATGRVDGSTVF